MITETRFTPGPFQVVEDDVWDTRGDGEPGVPLVRADFGSDRRWGRKISREEIAANMALFASAPEFYEALIAILGPLNVCSDNRNVSDDVVLPVEMTMGELRAARAALAKAGTSC